MRKRPAPRAVRKAISRSLVAARTNNRFATFAHAINSTNPTAPKRSSRVGLVLPTSCSRKETRRRFQPLFESGYCASSRRAIMSVSACACASVTPALSFPMGRMKWALRCFMSADKSKLIGTHNSVVCGKLKSCGITPMTSQVLPSSASVLFTMAGSPAKRFCQSP